ncbi:hypothetical protein [Promicromonospora soli]
MDLFAAWLAVQVSRDDVSSALPNAPVQEDRFGQAIGAIRRRSAGVLHRLADHLEPHPGPAASPPVSSGLNASAARAGGVRLAGDAGWDRHVGGER